MAALRAHPEIQALVIRGISDLLTAKKAADAKGWQHQAARNAAAFAFQILATFTFPPASRKTSSRKTSSRKTSSRKTGAKSRPLPLSSSVKGSVILPLVARLCDRMQITPVEMNRRLRKWAEEQPAKKWLQFINDLILRKDLRRSEVLFTQKQAHSLAEQFSIHPLLIDPVFSRVSRHAAIGLRCRGSFVNVGSPDDLLYGVKSQYSIPDTRLEGLDAAFGHLELLPGGRSDLHEHPGDEILIALEGECQVMFVHSGIRMTLRSGDMVHFYGEQKHVAWNVAHSRCRLFVIRFYQIETDGTRQHVSDQIESNVYLPWNKIPVVRDWVSQIKTFVPVQTSDPTMVQDPVGFGRFLEKLRIDFFPDCRHPRDLSDVSRALKKRGVISRDFDIERLEDGLDYLPKRDLLPLGVLYDTAPILLYNWLFPAAQGAVAIVTSDDGRNPIHLPDLVEVSPEFVKEEGVRYWVPRRNLALSDIAVTHVRLARGAKTPVNKHPGSELLVPTRGAVEVEIPDLNRKVAAHFEPLILGHYPSHMLHSVWNPTDDDSEFWVIRFHGALRR